LTELASVRQMLRRWRPLPYPSQSVMPPTSAKAKTSPVLKAVSNPVRVMLALTSEQPARM
jgi:hypothetical protein